MIEDTMERVARAPERTVRCDGCGNWDSLDEYELCADCGSSDVTWFVEERAAADMLGRQELLVEVMACENPAARCRGPAVAINGTVIIGSCGGPYRVVARGREQARYLLALPSAPEGKRTEDT